MTVDYGQILHKSWAITKKNKWLWVFGLILATFSSSGGGSFNLGNSFNSKDISSSNFKISNRYLSADQYLFMVNAIENWFLSIPISTWITLGISIFVLMLVGIVISTVISSWVQASLISGIATAHEDKPVTLTSASAVGFAKFGQLIIFGLINFGLVIVATLALIVLGILAATISPIVAILIMVPGAIFFIAGVVLLAFISLYAQRLIVLKNLSPWAAWKKSLNLTKGAFLPTLVMGFINMGIGCGVGCVSALIMGIIIGLPAVIIVVVSMSTGSFVFPGWPAIVVLIVSLLLAINLNLLVAAIKIVFDYSNYHQIFIEALKNDK